MGSRRGDASLQSAGFAGEGQPRNGLLSPLARQHGHLPQGGGGDQIVERIFKGPLNAMLRDALHYLQNSVITEYITKYPDRAEATRYFNVPYHAVEEALVNAVYHRSYEEREPIEVQIAPDEIVIMSYPGPDRSVEMERLRTGNAAPRRYRNRRIGEFLKELELSEGRCTGIRKILGAMRANGSPEPLFETDAERTWFMVRLPIRPAPKAAAAQVAAQVDNLPNHLTDRELQQIADALGTPTAQVAAQVEKLIQRAVSPDGMQPGRPANRHRNTASGAFPKILS